MILDQVWNPRKWQYIPPPWIQPYLLEDCIAYIFFKLFTTYGNK